LSKNGPKDTALRLAFIKLLSEIRERDKTLNKAKIAEILQIRRQTLWLYSKGQTTPGGEVIKRACDHWKVRLTVKGFEFSGSAFETRKKAPPEGLPIQRNLFDVLGTLTNQNLEAKVVGKVGDSFYLQIRIKNAN
jgi:hypothetical protein